MALLSEDPRFLFFFFFSSPGFVSFLSFSSAAFSSSTFSPLALARRGYVSLTELEAGG